MSKEKRTIFNRNKNVIFHPQGNEKITNFTSSYRE